MKFNILGLAALLLLSLQVSAFEQEPTDTTKVWHHMAPETGVNGISTEEAYQYLKSKNRKSVPIVVAIIDSGTDIEHEDLKGEKWVNKGEIAGNGKDDDNNGYIDDVHGWNFIGGKGGKNITAANMEITRIYRELSPKYKDKKISDFQTEADKDAFRKFLSVKNKYEKKKKEGDQEYKMVKRLVMADSLMRSALGKEEYTAEDLKNFKTEDQQLSQISQGMYGMFQNGLSQAEIMDYKKYVETKMLYQLNLDFNPRAEVIGDNPKDPKDIHYGNNDVIGTSADHGTHVAGIVAATRGNGIGMEGIADNVQLMIVRTVPDGDERDKDVANAIKYAINNGAKVINMSFGKSTTTLKGAVDEAIKLAEEKGVLLIHAAGNDALDIDVQPNYPTPLITGRKKPAKTWITVGASASTADSSIVATFSNYGKDMVDIFAPGVDIYSTYPNNEYKANSGTSMAAPVVAGVAALVWSHYPELTAKQVKKALLKSAIRHKKLVVKRPISGEEKETQKFVADKKIKFKKLSDTGGVVNALEAVKLAEKMAK